VPLSRLVADRVLWNLHRPSLTEAVRGAIMPQEETPTYNHRALYPRPPEDTPWRGMELVSRALARNVPDLRLGHQVVGLDPDRQAVWVQTAKGVLHFRWQSGVIATAPLPQVLRFCKGLPSEFRNAVLPWNGVSSVGLRIRGRRPDLGTWRYYPSPDVSFTRLIFLHEFDPGLAPAHGWPLLAEVVWRGEDGAPEPEVLANRVIADARRVGVLAACEVLGASVQVVAPAYARFERGVEEVVNAALAWLRERNVHPLGRYGRWEYSSMQHALMDGLSLGRALRDAA
jgi:protoporphyrinogen oxidase